MDKLTPNWDQLRPTDEQIESLWDNITISPLNSWSKAAEVLKEKFKETYVNGGAQLHKYKITGNKHFIWFAERNRLDEINFLPNFFSHHELKNYREDLKIKNNVPGNKGLKSPTDIFNLVGDLAQLLGHGGAYRNLESSEAWKVSCDFVNEEFQNRFDEVLSFYYFIESADWFYNINWDYSILLFDKRNYEITIIDITDTD